MSAPLSFRRWWRWRPFSALEKEQPSRRFGQRGVAVEARERLTFSAAVAAFERQDAEALQALLDGGLDPDAAEADGRTLLMSTAGMGFAEGVGRLLRAGAEVEAKTDDGWSALQHAAMALSDGSVRLLLTAGADPTARTRSGQSAIDAAKDRLRPRWTWHSPFSERHIFVTLPAWHLPHPGIDTLIEASKHRTAPRRAAR
jgi:hypothetical protein